MKRFALACVAVTALGLAATVLAAIRLPGERLGSTERPASSGFPRTVRIPGGESIVLAAAPRAVVATSARALDFCAALLPASCIAAIPRDALEYTILGDAKQEYANRPSFRQYDAETLIAFAPDLVVADPWQSLDTHARLRSAGILVLVLPEANRIEEMMDLLRALGRVFGEERSAALEVADLSRRIASLAQRAVDRAPLAVLPYSCFGAQGYSAGSGTTLHEALTLAGLRNAFAEHGENGHQTVDFEALIGIDPDALLLALPLDAPVGPSGDRGGSAEALLIQERALEGVAAVRERRFLRLPAGLYASASHGIVRAAELLADQADSLLRHDPPRRP